jgi:hypothetical protein
MGTVVIGNLRHPRCGLRQWQVCCGGRSRRDRNLRQWARLDIGHQRHPAKLEPHYLRQRNLCRRRRFQHVPHLDQRRSVDATSTDQSLALWRPIQRCRVRKQHLRGGQRFRDIYVGERDSLDTNRVSQPRSWNLPAELRGGCLRVLVGIRNRHFSIHRREELGTRALAY